MRIGLTLIGFVLFTWGLSLTGPFHFDDYNLFVDPLITGADGWWKVWQPIQTRPLTQFTFWLSYALAGPTPWAFHFWNLALHSTAVLLVWRVLRSIISERAAVIAALIFAIHPIQAEPVNYVFARSTELSTVLCLVSWWLWVRGRLWWAVGAFGLALLAKEECVTFPLFLALFGWRRRQLAAMLGLAFLLGLRVLIATKFVAASGGGFASRVSPLEYFTAQGIVILRYLRLVLVPWGFTVDTEITVWLPWLAWAGVLAIVAVAWRFRNVWVLGALVLLIPSSSIFPADDLAADRRMYLPMIAISAAIGFVLERWNPKALFCVFTPLLLLSLTRTTVWNSERTLWQEAVDRAPGKLRPRIQLARSSSPAEGLEILNEAKKRWPDDFNIETERGRLLLAAGQAPEALGAFGRALALKPSSAMAMNNRGVALAALGQNEAARADFERALKADPCFTEAASNLQRLGYAAPAVKCEGTQAQLRDRI